MSSSSKRRLKCVKCNSRTARLYSLWSFQLFIHCNNCGRDLFSKVFEVDSKYKPDSKDLALTRKQLLIDWQAGISTEKTNEKTNI